MTDQPFKPLLLDLLRQAQVSQNAFFQQLPAAELVASGTPECWSAKDHVAHMTFWRQRLALRVRAIIQHAPQPESQNYEELNPRIFEEHRAQPWSAILTASDQAYADLIALTQQLTEEDLTARSDSQISADGTPLYLSFMGNCYEHTQIHLAQYLSDRQEDARAREIYEAWARRVIEAGVPDTLKGYMLYNLGCYYATHGQVEQARTTVQHALTLYPALSDFSLTDPDLAVLRPDSSQ